MSNERERRKPAALTPESIKAIATAASDGHNWIANERYPGKAPVYPMDLLTVRALCDMALAYLDAEQKRHVRMANCMLNGDMACDELREAREHIGLLIASPPADRKAVIEECAKVCEVLRDEWHARRISVPLPNDCAEAIRAMAGAGGGKG